MCCSWILNLFSFLHYCLIVCIWKIFLLKLLRFFLFWHRNLFTLSNIHCVFGKMPFWLWVTAIWDDAPWSNLSHCDTQNVTGQKSHSESQTFEFRAQWSSLKLTHCTLVTRDKVRLESDLSSSHEYTSATKRFNCLPPNLSIVSPEKYMQRLVYLWIKYKQFLV